ncbi:MAG TPA: ABC transporter permease [Pyrinomonadaceae bacterium]|jgi:putative ABC transport system permease protein|nr:ABC transporter permease [Pyrinomonadaceae bacterium]
MRILLQDLRYGFRMLLKRPGFTTVAVVALALGIGANTAIFSVVNGVLLRPLPFKEPERLVAVWETNAQFEGEMRNRNELALGNFLDWRAQNQVFEQLAALSYASANLTGVGEPERIQSFVATTNLFQTLGVQPFLGRAFLPEEESPQSARAVILSHGLWQRRFGSDPKLVGKALTLNGNQYTVVGVMPPGFQLQFPTSIQVDMWLPMRIDPADADRKTHYLYALGRLRPGVSLEQAQAGMSAISGQLQQQYPETNAGKGAHVVSLHGQLVGNVRPYIYVLFAAVGFVLLIACANVANLLLARVAARSKEVAIRIALGAGRLRLIRQLLTESIMLSALGGLLGLLLAYWGIDLLIALSPSDVPRLSEIGLHGPVFGWTFGVSLLTGLLFGLAPALQASKPDLNEALKESGRSTGGLRRSRMRSLLVVSEVALALVLLVGAGLMIKSFMRLRQVSPGFEPSNLLTMNISLPRQKYKEKQQANIFFDQLFERLRTVPGVESVGGVDPLPLSNSNTTTGFIVEGGPVLASADRPEVGQRAVTPGYFQTMRIPLLKGRQFSEQDREDAPLAVIINEAAARRFWPTEEVIGKRLGFEDDGKDVWREVVGIVGNVKHERLDAEAKPEVYFPYRQYPKNFMSLVVRTSSEPLNMIASVREQVLAIDRDQPVFDIMTMEQRISRSVAQSRFIMLLLGLFSALALLLAAVGIYGVMAYVVAQRTHEIGIRMALGAQARDVLRMVIRQGMTLAFVGVGIGLLGAFALTRLMSSLLFGVTATDPLTFILVALVLSAVALVAIIIPARRATRVDPMIALRYE